MGLGALCVVLALYLSPLSMQINYAIATHDVSRFWIRAFPNGAFLLVFPGLILAIAAPCYVVGSLIYARIQREKPKPTMGYVAVIWLVNWAILAGLFATAKPRVFWSQRRAGLQRAATRAQPLIAAIERYKADEGRTPANLEELVPRYTPQIPATGMAAYPEFRYSSRARRPGGADVGVYELSVFTPFGLSFDRFYYWPDRAYPEISSSGGIERVGDWAYLHE